MTDSVLAEELKIDPLEKYTLALKAKTKTQPVPRAQKG